MSLLPLSVTLFQRPVLPLTPLPLKELSVTLLQLGSEDVDVPSPNGSLAL
jgi:hypothetical protein